MPSGETRSGCRPAAETAVDCLAGVGAKRAASLREAGMSSVEDLLYHLPLRYEDKRRPVPLSACRSNEKQLYRLRVTNVQQGRTGRQGRLHRLQILAVDQAGREVSLRWINQPFRARGIETGNWYDCFGQLVDEPGRSEAGGTIQAIDNPELFLTMQPEAPLAAGPHIGRIVPVYRRVGGVGSSVIRTALFRLLAGTVALPAATAAAAALREHGFPGRAELFRGIHCPPGSCHLAALNSGRSLWHRGLAFEELYLEQRELAERKRKRLACRKERGLAAGLQEEVSAGLVATVEELSGFTLTGEQRAAVADIAGDLCRPHPMRRLLQGEVGCGKTVVAYAALFQAVCTGGQAALMAPTEALAWQHYQRLEQMLRGAADNHPLRRLAEQIILVTGGADAVRCREQQERLAGGDALIAIGTHALLSSAVVFRDLSLAVVDEQQRFGVRQREQLRLKGANPDLLVISATPIPRTMGLRLCGDMELTRIRELPRGRREVQTICLEPEQSAEALEILERELDSGNRGFVVCPTVKGSGGREKRSAETVYNRFRSGTLARHAAGLLHGGMDLDQARAVMAKFQSGESRLLVTTTVVEVGLDVPRATVMIVLEPERFGLSQLHQLRGRVGRGERPGWFILLRSKDDKKDEAGRRLAVLVSSDDGFHIAEEDLRLRGSGDLTGALQAGAEGYRAVAGSGNGPLLALARAAAFRGTILDCPIDDE